MMCTYMRGVFNDVHLFAAAHHRRGLGELAPPGLRRARVRPAKLVACTELQGMDEIDTQISQETSGNRENH